MKLQWSETSIRDLVAIRRYIAEDKPVAAKERIEFIERDLKVSPLTATKYLEALTSGGFLQKQKVGRSTPTSISH